MDSFDRSPCHRPGRVDGGYEASLFFCADWAERVREAPAVYGGTAGGLGRARGTPSRNWELMGES